MKKIFLFSIGVILLSFHAYAQHYNKLRLYNLYDNSLLDSIEVMTIFEDCESMPPLMMDFDSKDRFYYYDYYKQKFKTLQLRIVSPHFFRPGMWIHDASFNIRTDTCKKGICHLDLLPTTVVNFYEQDTSSYHLVNVSFQLKTKCDDKNRKMFYDDKLIYMQEDCTTINDSLCSYSFNMSSTKHTFYFTPDNTLKMKFSFQEKELIKNIALSLDIKEVKIYVDQKRSTVVVEEIRR